MAGKTPALAVKAFSAPIQEALGLFASGKVTTDTYEPDVEGVLAFNRGEVVKLRGGGKVGLSVSMRYRVVPDEHVDRGPWKVSTVGYMYDLHVGNKSLYEYHWHPISQSVEVRPHLHCAAVGDKGHIPTGRVMIEDVLNLAIQYGAEPNSTERWAELDKLNREKFGRGATWGIGPA
ncbi:hypothetical protein [Mycobacteroides abscessus]|uniref:hypothetical protein n=2 Tax=Mycobacteroides abscessus TaxID=36809 RepID=UPI0005DA7702|nr:hypothetical protein [Mycobacteroides abscessus]MDO3202691.1 hypothetical protein [Mycobacteroides abscessus subsp. abscessus]PVB37850.1 hypothetical protein DDJ39_19345 [Mycobacteroides abscessus]RIS03360.1 hypothetical protein D2E45_15695 [Mycobacteroides abscessus]RIS68179.1 hypothetical protein D2E70_19940 [Mycobacteroides abscessus]CPR85938.1 Uncharacterised protein [Mycobacteroides abscessus]